MKEWYTPRASTHVFDPYSLCLVVAGLLLHLLWGTDDIDAWIYGFLAAIAVELVWEVVGNTPLVLKRIRSNNGACGEYTGTEIIFTATLINFRHDTEVFFVIILK